MTQVEPQHYLGLEYDTKARFASYWHQISEVVNLAPDSVLEIGIGAGFVSDYLRKRGFRVTTLDLDCRLKPDIVASMPFIPFSAGAFELVVAYEVLEHLLYVDALETLRQIHRVTRRNVVLSLPDCTRAYRLEVEIPRVRDLKFVMRLPVLKPPVHKFVGEHHWEIGVAGHPLSQVVEDIKRSGFRVMKSYRVFEMLRHRFFVLEKQ